MKRGKMYAFPLSNPKSGDFGFAIYALDRLEDWIDKTTGLAACNVFLRVTETKSEYVQVHQCSDGSWSWLLTLAGYSGPPVEAEQIESLVKARHAAQVDALNVRLKKTIDKIEGRAKLPKDKIPKLSAAERKSKAEAEQILKDFGL